MKTRETNDELAVRLLDQTNAEFLPVSTGLSLIAQEMGAMLRNPYYDPDRRDVERWHKMACEALDKSRRVASA